MPCLNETDILQPKNFLPALVCAIILEKHNFLKTKVEMFH